MRFLFAAPSFIGYGVLGTFYVILWILFISKAVHALILSMQWRWIAFLTAMVLICSGMYSVTKYQILCIDEKITPLFLLPGWFYILSLIPLVGSMGWAYRKVRKWKDTHISTSSIQEGLDALDTGLCYFRADGRVIMQNEFMNQIRKEFLDSRERDGKALWQEIVKHRIMDTTRQEESSPSICLLQMRDGRMIQFRLAEILLSGMPVSEITASDVTEQMRLNRLLDEQNKEIEERNQWLNRYFLQIDEVVREQEILDTRIRIHDDLGKILLITRKSIEDPENQELKEEVLSMWEKNAVMFSAESEDFKKKRSDRKTDSMASIHQAAVLSGLGLIFDGDALDQTGNLDCEDSRISEIYELGLHECMTNTILHGKGKNIYVNVRKIKGVRYQITILNDGEIPAKPVKEGGGLKNLRKKVEKMDGSMEYCYTERFGICIIV